MKGEEIMLTSYKIGSFDLPKPKTEGPKEAPKKIKKGAKTNDKKKRTSANNRRTI